MKKAVAIVFLLIVIGLSFGFVAIKTMANGPEDNYFNQEWRSSFARSPFLRQVFSLHYDGDARFDYIESGYAGILIEVDAMTGIEPDARMMEEFRRKVESITGKKTRVIISDRTVPYLETVGSQEISSIAHRYRTWKRTRGDASLYLLLLSADSENPDLLGETLREDGVVVFYDSVKSFTDLNPNLLQNYVFSTALHEFGHQLGLNHNADPGCLMNESVDNARIMLSGPEDVIEDFCPSEKQVIYNRL